MNKHNYLNYLRQQYGPIITNNVFYYGKTLFKIAKLKCDLLFLKTCKKESLLPNFVQFRIPSTHQHHQKAIQNCYREILVNELKLKKRQLTSTYKFNNNLKSLIEHELDKSNHEQVLIILNEMATERITSWTATHLKKLNTLRQLKYPSSNVTQTTVTVSPIKNYSKRVLTADETLALENGLDFILPSLRFDEETFIANIETLFVNLLGYCSEKTDYDEREIDEKISYNLTPEQLCLANKLRKMCDTFRNHAKKSMVQYKKEIAPILKTLKNLSKDKTIYITRADKGRAVVILDKLDYINKMELILNDSKTFKQLDDDPTISREDKLQKKLLNLKNSGFLTEEEYKFARPVGSQPGKAYGLPKIHKDDIPLRPIISACNTYSYRLSKLLARKLKHLRTNSSIVTNTFKFVNELQNLKLNNIEVKMVSFDIVSLFTRVPLLRTIELILEKMYGPIHTCISSRKKYGDWCSKCQHRHELKGLLETATKESHFIFNKKIYSQTEGIAMGSPLGPLFADIYINYLESELKHKLEENGVLYWKRFVDDSFVLIKHDADVKKLLDILNSFDIDIQFTAETEINHSIPFLDILITRVTNNLKSGPVTPSSNDPSIKIAPVCKINQTNTPAAPLTNDVISPNLISSQPTLDITHGATNNDKEAVDAFSISFSTSVYRKPTFTGLLLKWNSFVPHSYKVSAIVSMIYRAIKFCSSYLLMHEELEYIQILAAENGYPTKFVQNLIRKILNRHLEGSKTPKKITIEPVIDNNGKKKEQIFLDLPFIGKETKILGKKIINLVKHIRPDCNIQPIPRPPPKIASFFPQKDKINKDAQSNIVYLISCSECNESYIGKTIRQASRRHLEHGAPHQPKQPKQLKQPLNAQVGNSELNIQLLRRSDRLKTKPKVNYSPADEDEKQELVTMNHEQLMKSALYKHQINNNHKIDWNNWKIVTKDGKKYQLLVRESLHILHQQPTLNRTVSSIPLIVYPDGLQISKPNVKFKLVINNRPQGGTNS
jgi:hypothetical protein